MLPNGYLNEHVKVVDGHGKGSGYEFSISDIDKIVFFTREAAEEELKKAHPLGQAQ